MNNIVKFLHDKKYEVLLLSLVQHLFIGMFLTDISHYSVALWAGNVILLGISSTGVFIKKGKLKNTVRKTLFTAVLCFTLFLAFTNRFAYFYPAVGIIYVMFFLFIFLEVMQFLVRPGYINADIIVAAVCGYFLLIEISVFLMMSIFFMNPLSFTGISRASIPATSGQFYTVMLVGILISKYSSRQ